MNDAGAVELLMPVVQPAELWQESGRFQKYGPEVASRARTATIATSSSSRRAKRSSPTLRVRNSGATARLPKNFYHIQTKFRDERRPRFGVMRGREFTMKDAYSFDRDVKAAGLSYQRMYDAYVRIFERMGLTFRAVAADTGAIGGDRSHEFQVIADTGEDAIVYSPKSVTPRTSNWPRRWLRLRRAAPSESMRNTPTPARRPARTSHRC
jgi:prolyl-tRNA synthetase